MSTVVETPARISEAKVLRGGLVVAAGLLAGQGLGFVRQATIAYLLGFPAPSKAQGRLPTEIMVRARPCAPGQQLAVSMICWGH